MPTLQLPSRAAAAMYDRVNAGPEEAGLSALHRDLVELLVGSARR